MRVEMLRWPLFFAAALCGIKILVSYDHVTLAAGLACAGLWYLLSRRKAWSLDRDRRGVPMRGSPR